jgi:hypothetical protein
MSRRLLATVGVLALLLGAPAAGTSTVASTVGDTPTRSAPDAPAEDVGKDLEIDLQYGTTTATVTLRVVYPARSASEAAAARNDSLDPSWFEGRQRVEYVFNRTADSNDSLDGGNTWVGYQDHCACVEGTDPSQEHGWVAVEYDVAWTGFAEVGEDVVIGRHYAAAFHDGWSLTLVVPNSWEPTTLDDDASVSRSQRSGAEYVWGTIDNDSQPLVAFSAPVRPTETDAEAPLGVSGGVVLAAAAMAAVIWRRRAKGSRSSRDA